MIKSILYFSLLILLSIFSLISCGQSKANISENKSIISGKKIITEEEYDLIRKEAQANVDKRIRRVTHNEIRNIIGSAPVKVNIIQDFLPPNKSKWMVEETTENGVKRTEIIYIGDVEYRKENNNDWVMRNLNSKNTDDGPDIIAKKDESNKEFTIEDTKIENEPYRILTSKTVTPQSKILTENRIWINKEGLIYKEESKSGLGGLGNLLSSSTTNYVYTVKDVEIEAPIK